MKLALVSACILIGCVAYGQNSDWTQPNGQTTKFKTVKDQSRMFSVIESKYPSGPIERYCLIQMRSGKSILTLKMFEDKIGILQENEDSGASTESYAKTDINAYDAAFQLFEMVSQITRERDSLMSELNTVKGLNNGFQWDGGNIIKGSDSHLTNDNMELFFDRPKIWTITPDIKHIDQVQKYRVKNGKDN